MTPQTQIDKRKNFAQVPEHTRAHWYPLAMDKARCKAFFGTESIITPPGMVYYKKDVPRLRRAGPEVAHQLGYPVVVKPSRDWLTLAKEARAFTSTRR